MFVREESLNFEFETQNSAIFHILRLHDYLH